VLPKKNLASFSPEWKDVLTRIVDDLDGYLDQYFMRELSESYFAADKDRFGQQLRRRREDRREMAGFGVAVLHNLFSVRVGAG
jgi:transposase